MTEAFAPGAAGRPQTSATVRRSAERALKKVRSWELANAVATGLLKRVVGDDAPRWVVEHLPRTGVVDLALPDAGSIRMWSGDDWLTSRVWWRGIDGFEPEVVRPFLRLATTAGTVLDVGAYTGYYALLAARVNPAARVLAFEPNPVVSARLGSNLALNPELRVTVLPYAVGACRSLGELHLGGPGLASSSSLSPRWRGRHESMGVAVADLDSMCTEWGLKDVDLVKIDVESGEPSVIAGMTRLLGSDRPAIFTEVLGGADADYGRMSDALRVAGYRFFRLLPDGTVREELRLHGTDERDAVGRRAVNHLLCHAEKVPAWLQGVPSST